MEQIGATHVGEPVIKDGDVEVIRGLIEFSQTTGGGGAADDIMTEAAEVSTKKLEKSQFVVDDKNVSHDYRKEIGKSPGL